MTHFADHVGICFSVVLGHLHDIDKGTEAIEAVLSRHLMTAGMDSSSTNNQNLTAQTLAARKRADAGSASELLEHQENPSQLEMFQPETHQPETHQPNIHQSKYLSFWFRLRLVAALVLLSALFIGVRHFLLANSERHMVGASKAAAVSNAAPVNVIAIQPVTSYEEMRTYSGTVVALRSSQLGFGRAGEVVQMMVSSGDRVTAGDALALLDTESLQASRQELLARRAQAVAGLDEMLAGPRSETISAAAAAADTLRAQLTLSENVSQRRQQLFEQGAISREELDEVLSEKAALQARLDESVSQLSELQAGTRREQIAAQNAKIQELDASIAKLNNDLNKSELKAPFNGTISARLVDEGTVVNASQPIVELVENDKLEARIGVPVGESNKLQPGQVHNLTIAQNQYPAELTAVLPTLDADTRTVTVVLALDGAVVQNISPGQVAQMELAETVTASGFWLPTTALIGGGSGLWSCYVLADPKAATLEPGDGQSAKQFAVEQRDVEILYTESDRVLVRGTLSPGDRVIVDGNHRLVPGQLVYPVQARQAAAEQTFAQQPLPESTPPESTPAEQPLSERAAETQMGELPTDESPERSAKRNTGRNAGRN